MQVGVSLRRGRGNGNSLLFFVLWHAVVSFQGLVAGPSSTAFTPAGPGLRPFSAPSMFLRRPRLGLDHRSCGGLLVEVTQTRSRCCRQQKSVCTRFWHIQGISLHMKSRGTRARRPALAMCGENGSNEDKGEEKGRTEQQPSNDPLDAMKKWSSFLQTGQERVDDLKMKTILALDNLFSGGFMQEGKGESDMLPVLRKFMMDDFEGYSPPRAQVAASLLDDFENFGAPQALTAPSLSDDANSFQGGGADVAGWGRTQRGAVGDDLQLERLQPLDRQQFRGAVQSGLSEMAAEDIDLVFDTIDKDGDGTLTLEELYETYKTVQTEIVTDQEINEMQARDFELSAAKLRPQTPDAAFSNLLPVSGETWGGEGAGREASPVTSAGGGTPVADLAARMKEWEEVCNVLTAQSEYLPPEGQETLQEAVAFTAELLLLDGPEAAADGLRFTAHHKLHRS